jgi:uncharacterized protein (DUF362 family)
MEDDNANSIDRRLFIQGTLAAVILAGCAKAETKKGNGAASIKDPTESQMASKKVGRSQVAIVRAQSYEEDLFESIKATLGKMQMPNFSGKHVVLKPNMVEYEEGYPITTNPAVVKAAVKLCNHLGAKKITVAEGPGHMRDIDMLLAKTGIGKAVQELGLPFVDLNLDDVVKVPIENGFTNLKYIFLPKTIVEADAVVSLPKMKTHHWVGVTLSMKNLFGVIPGRKYGYPKNLLHFKGIPQCIMDINRTVKPAFAIVDGIVGMEGDGPVHGTAKNSHVLVLGDDLAAVDATCARIMGFKPTDFDYINVAGKVIGNIEETQIDLFGAKIEEVMQKFEPSITFKDKSLLVNAEQQAS